DLDPLLSPRSVAVWGTLETHPRLAACAVANLAAGTFEGRVLEVPDDDAQLTRLGQIVEHEGPLDLVLAMRAPAGTQDLACKLHEKGLARSLVVPAGTSDPIDASIPVLGPGSVGIVNVPACIHAFASYSLPPDLEAGGVSIVSQSAALA